MVNPLKNPLLAKKLKELRIAHSYTQDYVASILDIARQTYSHYETGKRTPSSEILFKLAGLYHISISDLMQISINVDRVLFYDIPAPTSSSENLSNFLEYCNNPTNQKKYQYHSILEKELLYYFEKISDDDKREMIEFIKIKAKKQK